MVRCPVCGAEVGEPMKTWRFGPKNRDKQAILGLYKCPNNHYFRRKFENY